MTVVPAAAPTRLDPRESHDVRCAVESVLADGPWVLGRPVEDFERAFAAFLGMPAVVGVGNGTDALLLAFSALGLPVGSTVLMAANEGGYAASAARAGGYDPRPVDVDPTTMGPTVDGVDAAWVPGVSALVVTHLHGDAVPTAGLRRWCDGRGVTLVEDCAQAHGLFVDGEHVGAGADAATFSFYPTKNLAAVGDGGAVAFRDETAADRARTLRQYGWGERFRIDVPGGRNSRLDTLQAAVLSARLAHLGRRNARRRSIAERYRTVVKGSGLRVHGDPVSTVAHHAVVVTEPRDQLRNHLESSGISTAVHYPFLLQEMPGLRLAPSATPGASWLRDRILSLPCFPEMSDDEADAVCDALSDWVAAHE